MGHIRGLLDKEIGAKLDIAHVCHLLQLRVQLKHNREMRTISMNPPSKSSL